MPSSAPSPPSERPAEAVIPAKRNRKVPIPHDRRAHKGRHKVEDLSGRIKDFGRIVLRVRRQGL